MLVLGRVFIYTKYQIYVFKDYKRGYRDDESPFEATKVYHGENGGSLLGWWPSCLTPARSPSNGDIPNKYPLYKMHMGLIIKGPQSQGYHHFPYECRVVCSTLLM